jgi:hypothetical protein
MGARARGQPLAVSGEGRAHGAYVAILAGTRADEAHRLAQLCAWCSDATGLQAANTRDSEQERQERWLVGRAHSPHGSQKARPVCAFLKPGSQAKQLVVPFPSAYLPASQAEHSVRADRGATQHKQPPPPPRSRHAPAMLAYRPGVHGSHTVVWGSRWKRPVSQSMHCERPVMLAYLPGAHWRHWSAPERVRRPCRPDVNRRACRGASAARTRDAVVEAQRARLALVELDVRVHGARGEAARLALGAVLGAEARRVLAGLAILANDRARSACEAACAQQLARQRVSGGRIRHAWAVQTWFALLAAGLRSLGSEQAHAALVAHGAAVPRAVRRPRRISCEAPRYGALCAPESPGIALLALRR